MQVWEGFSCGRCFGMQARKTPDTKKLFFMGFTPSLVMFGSRVGLRHVSLCAYHSGGGGAGIGPHGWSVQLVDCVSLVSRMGTAMMLRQRGVQHPDEPYSPKPISSCLGLHRACCQTSGHTYVRVSSE